MSKHQRNQEPSQRQLRVGEELRHALARMLQRGELRDPALQGVAVTVTEVRVSPDLKNATAYVMPLGGEHRAEVIAGLTRSAGYLRAQIAREVQLRLAPRSPSRSTPPSITPAASTSCCIAPRSSAISAPRRRKSPRMGRRHRGQPIHGWIILDKPLGMSSSQAVGAVRRLLDAAKAGHGGTLDPLATGVLPIALGEATKTVAWAMAGRKTYRFTSAGARPGTPTMPRAGHRHQRAAAVTGGHRGGAARASSAS